MQNSFHYSYWILCLRNRGKRLGQQQFKIVFTLTKEDKLLLAEIARKQSNLSDAKDEHIVANVNNDH